MFIRDGCESRKNLLDEIWLNPTSLKNRQSAGFLRTERASTTISSREYAQVSGSGCA